MFSFVKGHLHQVTHLFILFFSYLFCFPLIYFVFYLYTLFSTYLYCFLLIYFCFYLLILLLVIYFVFYLFILFSTCSFCSRFAYSGVSLQWLLSHSGLLEQSSDAQPPTCSLIFVKLRSVGN